MSLEDAPRPSPPRMEAASRRAPRRRPAGGGYARGEETRARIVEAAMQVFGEEGYERASTRRIADLAQVRPPAVQYYFTSKEGLHRACGEHVLAHAGALSSLLAELQGRAAAADPAAAVEMVCLLADTVVDLACDKAASGHGAFLARMQVDGGGPAREVIRTRLVEPLQALTAQLVRTALGPRPSETEVRLKAVLALGQGSAFHASRENTLAFLHWPDFNGARREAVKAMVRANVAAMLRR